MNKRACVFAHFDKDNIVDEYVYYYLKELVIITDKIVFVTVSDINAEHVQRLELMNIDVIKRNNIGYDFYSYKIGIQNLNLNLYDEVIICNDSAFGPLIPLDELFSKMNSVNCDFWGITESNLVAYHVQSYFIVYRKALVNSSMFYKSWNDIEVLEDKSQIIEKYEIGLSQLYIRNGFNGTVYKKDHVHRKTLIIYMFKLLLQAPSRLFSFIKDPIFYVNVIVKKQYNASVNFWKNLLTEGDLPFLKKSLVTDKKDGQENYKNIEIIFQNDSQYNQYDIKLIENYMKRFKD
ncbi:MAG: hypothetical protein COA39_010930 [Sulfurimonas sp.]|nr:hypothetical protein [Sulfurimonas sp.]